VIAADAAREEKIGALRARALEVLRPLLAGDGRFALLDYPNYPNVGDSMIWLGTRALLREAGARVPYATAAMAFRRDLLDRLAPSAPILLQGGGNFGDLWPRLQQFREHVVASCPDRRIVQLPQSIHFRDPANLARARRVLDAHPNLTLLLRDARSLEIARNEFRATSLLCPDLAFGLGPLRKRRAPHRDVVWLIRDDQESLGASTARAADGRAVDWAVDGRPTAWIRSLLTTVSRPRALGRAWLGVVSAYDAMSALRLASGVRLLSAGRVVVTDRLHGHILSVLLGIPNVVLDNSYGKVSGFVRAWTGDVPTLRFAATAEDAQAAAEALLRESAMGAVA
jgi:pyruvyl transferase EpsO